MGNSSKIRHRRRRRTLARARQLDAVTQAIAQAFAIVRLLQAHGRLASDPWEKIRRATGVLSGAPADAVADCEALHDEESKTGDRGPGTGPDPDRPDSLGTNSDMSPPRAQSPEP